MARGRDIGLLLRRFRYGETSQVLHVATAAQGRLHLLAKGAYRPTSRFYAALDLFDTLDLEWQLGAGRELGGLVAARIAVRRHRIAEDLSSYRAGLTVLELFDLASQDAPAQPELFERATAALDRLAARGDAGSDPRLPDQILVEFELGFLEQLGLAPSLRGCASCGGPAPASGPARARRAGFSAQCGGRLCDSCASEARALGKRVGTLPESVLDDAAHLARPGSARLPQARLTLVHDAVARFVEHQLQGRPKSYRSFLASPQRNHA